MADFASPFNLLKHILVYRLRFRFYILLLSLFAAGFGVLSPFFQKYFIDTLIGHQTHSLPFNYEIGIVTAIVLAFLCLLIAQGLLFFSNYLGNREAIILQKNLSETLYKKMLALRGDSMGQKPIGEIVQLYATDVSASTIFLEQTLPTGASTLFPLILGPLAISLLFQIPMAPTLTVMGVIIVVNTLLAFRQSKFFLKFKNLAGERIGIVSEWIQNIRAIRILGWTELFEKKIQAKRIEETNNRVKMVTNGQVMNAFSSSVTFFINIAALLTLIQFKQNQITPGELMALLWILGVFLVKPFRQLPWFFTFAFDGWTSIKRLSHFFELKDSGRHFITDVSAADPLRGSDGPAIEVRNLNLKINQQIILKNISFSVRPKEFIAIVGEVGAGKSLTLLSLMGETGAEFDFYQINGTNALSLSQAELCRYFSYVPQEGFVISANLRDNIAFDYDSSHKLESRITNSLQKSQFNLSHEYFNEGLDTEIGERGVNLSGGQKQRVNLARADFFDCPVMLLDDCLSALDVDTEKHLLRELFFGRWKNKTRILATHRLSVLKKVDRVLFLKGGELVGFDSYANLIVNTPAFREFTASLEETDKAAKLSHSQREPGDAN